MTLTDHRKAAEFSVLFGPDAVHLVAGTRQVIAELVEKPIPYEFMPNEDWRKLAHKDVASANRVFVEELLYRTHIAATTSLVRAFRWAEGCATAYADQLYLPFCSSCRGLLEAVSDAGYTLRAVPAALATNFQTLELSLRGRVNTLINAAELENSLVHYTEARRLDKIEKKELPESFQPQQAKKYIEETLEKYEPFGFTDWYSELCETTHPASDSVTYT